MCLGIPGKIIDKYSSNGTAMAKFDFGGVVREICVETVPEAEIGDYCIVHAGFALSVLSADEAQETLDLFDQIAEFNQNNPT